MNIAKETENFINQHPMVKENLKKGLINYSALARSIASELKIEKRNFDAILIAIRRHAEKITPSKEMENRIVDLLKKSDVNVKTKQCVFVLSQKVPYSSVVKLTQSIADSEETFHMIQGGKSLTIITSGKFFARIKKQFKQFILSEKKNLIEIVVKTVKEIESTPGVVSYMYSLFAEHGINIIETMSSWTETLFVIEEKDLSKAMAILRF